MIAQEAQTAQQAEAARLQKQAAASAAAAHSQAQLIEQLQAAETALADSHGSAQKLLRELNESRAARDAKQQELEGVWQLLCVFDQFKCNLLLRHRAAVHCYMLLKDLAEHQDSIKPTWPATCACFATFTST